METRILKTQDIADMEGTFNFQDQEPTADFMAERLSNAITRNGLKIPEMMGYFTLRKSIENAGILDLPGKPKFFKRLQREYKKITGEKLSDDLGGIIGNAHKLATETLTVPLWFKVTDQIVDLGSGYGNSSSCWYGYDSSYCHAPEIMEANNGIGILVYNQEEKIKRNGIARIWGVNTPQGIAYFNPYINLTSQGISQNKTDDIKFKIFSELIATQIMKLTQETIETAAGIKPIPEHYQDENNQKFLVKETNIEGNHIYVNQNRAMIITNNPDQVKSYYEPFENTADFNEFFCSNCHDQLDEDEACYNSDGEAFCQSCYDEYYIQCDRCGEEVRKSYGNETQDGYICDHCAQEYYTQCEECRTYHSNDEIEETAEGYLICQECFNDHYYECEECGKIERKEKANQVDALSQDESTRLICDECIEEATNDQEKLELIDLEIERIRAEQTNASYQIKLNRNNEDFTISRSGRYYTPTEINDQCRQWKANNFNTNVISITKGIYNITEKIMTINMLA